MNLKGKVCVVTGGAGLLGQVFCKKISDSGGIAIIADIDINAATKVAKNIPNSFACTLDITNKESIANLIKEVSDKYGQVHAVINNAYPRNKNYGKKFFEVEYADFCENTNLNLGGYFLVSQVFAEYFQTQNAGNIINIASIYGVTAPKFDIYDNTEMTMPVEYAVIKSGLIHLTKYMAKYFKGQNIRVNAISPGGIFDSQPESFLGKYKDHCLNKGMLDGEDLAGTLAFLLSDESKFINGQNIVVDDGFSV